MRCHHPARLDPAARDRLEHLHSLETFPCCHAGRFPESTHPVHIAWRKPHVGGELICQPAYFATAHGVGLTGERERPDAGATDAASGEMAIDDGVDFGGTLRRLIDALRVAGGGPMACDKTVE